MPFSLLHQDKRNHDHHSQTDRQRQVGTILRPHLIILMQYVRGKSRESIFAHCGKLLTGIRLPENSTIGVSKISMMMDASLENRKTVFSIPPQIVDETVKSKKMNGNRIRLSKPTVPV